MSDTAAWERAWLAWMDHDPDSIAANARSTFLAGWRAAIAAALAAQILATLDRSACGGEETFNNAVRALDALSPKDPTP